MTRNVNTVGYILDLDMLVVLTTENDGLIMEVDKHVSFKSQKFGLIEFILNIVDVMTRCFVSCVSLALE